MILAKFWPNNIVTLLSQMCAAGGEETLCTGGARNRYNAHLCTYDVHRVDTTIESVVAD